MPIPVFTPTQPDGSGGGGTGGGYTPPPKVPYDRVSHGIVQGSWTSPDGDVIDMWDCSTGFTWLAGRQGVDMPPYELVTQQNIDDDGQTIVGRRALARHPVLPVLLHLDGFGAWRRLQQRVMRAFDPLRGDGVLTITQPDGSARRLYATYEQGMEGQDIADPRGLWHRIYALQLVASDPWWYADKGEVLRFGVTAAGGLLDTPFLPLKLTSSAVIGETSADNTGDVPTYPVWTVKGPGTSVELRNRTTGRVMRFGFNLTESQSVTIDTRPRRQSVIRQDGVNLFSTTVGTPDFWPLLRGVNAVTIDVADATTQTAVTLEYTPRFITS